MSFETQGNQLSGGISREFWRDILRGPEKFEKIQVCVQLLAPKVYVPVPLSFPSISLCPSLQLSPDRPGDGASLERPSGAISW